MNTKQILEQLNDAANSLDKQGLHSEASILTDIMIKVAQQPGQSNLNTLYNNYQQNPQAQQQPNAQKPMYNDNLGMYQQMVTESNILKYAPQSSQFLKIEMEFNNYYKKINSIIDEIHRKNETGKINTLQQNNGSYNSIVMCNNIINYMKTLQVQLQNIFTQMQKLINPNNPYDQQTIAGYKKHLDESQQDIYKISELVNRYNSWIKQKQENPKQQVQTPQ